MMATKKHHLKQRCIDNKNYRTKKMFFNVKGLN